MPGYRKSIFIRFIMSYTILSVVLIGIMGGYWYTQANEVMEDEIVKDNYRIGNEGLANATVYFPVNNYVVDSNNFQMIAGHAEESAFILKLNEVKPKEWLLSTLADGSEVMTYVIKVPYETPSADEGEDGKVVLSYLEPVHSAVVSSR